MPFERSKALSHADLAAFMASGTLTLEGCTLTTGDVSFRREVRPPGPGSALAPQFEAAVTSDGDLLVAVDCTQDDVTRAMGLVHSSRIEREFCGL